MNIVGDGPPLPRAVKAFHTFQNADSRAANVLVLYISGNLGTDKSVPYNQTVPYESLFVLQTIYKEHFEDGGDNWMNEKHEIIIYQTVDGLTKIDVRMEGETLW